MPAILSAAQFVKELKAHPPVGRMVFRRHGCLFGARKRVGSRRVVGQAREGRVRTESLQQNNCPHPALPYLCSAQLSIAAIVPQSGRCPGRPAGRR